MTSQPPLSPRESTTEKAPATAEANESKRKRLINMEKVEADLLELDNKLEELACKQASIIGKAMTADVDGQDRNQTKAVGGAA
ncbi:MAG: hypothetical protein SGPRY_013494 [Prymnesium sp.]